MSEPGGVRFTPEMQKKAAEAIFKGEDPTKSEAPAEEPQDDAEGAEAAEAPEPAESAEAPAEEPSGDDAEEVSFDDLTAELLEAASKPERGPNERENQQKTRLVELGLSEQAAHQLAFHSGAENAQKVIDALSGKVSSEVASPADDPEGQSKAGVRLPESVVDELGGPAAEELGSALAEQFAAMQSQIAALQAQLVNQGKGEVLESMSAARTELMGVYPELRSNAQVEALKPLIRAAVTGGLTSDPAEALRLAVYKQFGVRSGDSAGANADSSTDPAPKPGRASQVGRKAATPESVKKRIAEMVFNNRPADEVLSFSEEMSRKMK